ncbi:hypothetical protein CSPAE12_03796 [Colletotrichum incanum]|nr:hypothetical protein CSPAE12_03796 [Colletotrichum incanum]
MEPRPWRASPPTKATALKSEFRHSERSAFATSLFALASIFPATVPCSVTMRTRTNRSQVLRELGRFRYGTKQPENAGSTCM